MLISPGGGFIPRLATEVDLAVPKLPDPPLLPALGDLETAEYLVGLYRGLVESRTKEPCPILSRRGAVASYRGFRDLVEAGHTFRELEIPPAGWANFSWDVWFGYIKPASGESSVPKRRRPPALGWTFLPARIEKHRGWFFRESGSYAGGRLLFSADQTELVKQRAALEQWVYWDTIRFLNKHGEITRAQLIEQIAQKSAELFPGGYETCLERARSGGEQQKARLAEMVKEGKFVW